MLVQATNLLGHSVASLEEKKRLGEVNNILIDRNNAKIIGLIVLIGNKFFGHRLFIGEMDILEIDKQGVAIRSSEDLIDPNEVIKAKKILDERFNIINLPAIAKTKEKLGKISDYIIDTQSMQITKFYVQNIFNDRIFSINDIYKITKKAVIFNHIETKGLSKSMEKQAIT